MRTPRTADAATALLFFIVALGFGVWIVSNFPHAYPQVALFLAAVTTIGAATEVLLVGAVHLLLRRRSRQVGMGLTRWRLLRHAATGAVVSELMLPILLLARVLTRPADIVGLLGGTY